jgi:molybdenum cofactor synthesis domain-containing protein
MYNTADSENNNPAGIKTVSVNDAIGMVIAHDITEIRPGKFKGCAFKKGHVVKEEDISHLLRLGKENLYILEIKHDEMHENDAACALAKSLAGNGVNLAGEPKEGRINLIAERDGLLTVNRNALVEFNTLGEVMCATVHNNSVVKKGELVAGTRAIPLIVKQSVVEEGVKIAQRANGILQVKEIKKPKAGIVITGNEVYYGRIKDAFKPVLTQKLRQYNGDIVGVYYAPDNAEYIEARIRELLRGGADLIITTGGMSVDPDDVTRFAIRNLGVDELIYGSPVLPGAMFLVAYIKGIPIIGIPACGMYNNITVFDMVLPRVLAGEKIGRKELAELGHGGLCLKCDECRYPVCPFGK